MRRRMLVSGIALLCTVGFIAGCSTGKVTMDIPAAPSETSMTVQDLLEDPFVQGIDAAYMSTLESEDLTANIVLTSADATVNGYSMMRQGERYRLVGNLVKTSNIVWMADGDTSCQRTFPEGETSTKESDAEAEWTCSEPGYDFYSPELERLAAVSPLAVLAANEELQQPLEVSFSSDPARFSVVFADESGVGLVTHEWVAEDLKVVSTATYPNGMKTMVEVYPSVTESIVSTDELNKLMVPPPSPLPSLPSEEPTASSPSPSPSPTESAYTGTPKMRALCERIVKTKISVPDALALAEKKGYLARVSSIDGEPQAGTMDYREDRFNFVTIDNVVMECTYG